MSQPAVGVAVFSGTRGPSPQEMGPAVEERGFESLFYTEHTHIPVATRRADGRSIDEYVDTYDPFVALAAAAATTSRLKLGTSVCLVTQRDPIVTAKEVASVDRLSGGRLLFGVGAGWNRWEMANHGTDPQTRMALLAERVAAMRAIWSSEQAEFAGEFVRFTPSWSWPKPVQQPHPPVLVGGNGPGAEERVLAFGDGWLPQAGPFASVDELAQRIGRLQHRAAVAGRAPVPVTLFGVPPDRAMLDALAQAGVDRCILPLRLGPAHEMWETLDRWAEIL